MSESTHNRYFLPVAEVLPGMHDENGCLTTATSYALTKIGLDVSPTILDEASERVAGQLPTEQNNTNLFLWELNQGVNIEFIYPSYAVNMRKYFEEGSKLGYRELVEEMLARYGEHLKEFYETSYTEAVFVQDMEHRRQVDSQFEPFRATGHLKEVYKNLDAQILHSKLSHGSVMATVKNGEALSAHAVVIDSFSEPITGIFKMEMFYPKKGVSEIQRVSSRWLADLVDLDYGITCLSR